MNNIPDGPLYVAAFSAVSMSTNPFDAVGILAPANSRVVVHEVRLGMQSSAPPTQGIGIQLLRGSTASSTSAAIVPRHLHGWASAPTAGSSVTLPCTTLASTASAVLISAGSWQLHNEEWTYRPHRDDRPILDVSQRLHVRATAPSTAMPIYGAIIFSEPGKPASS
jgi:hypothetical protein